MGLCIYSNGIIEEFLPIDNSFSDNELTKSFENYPEIRTHRLPEIPNCWCIWGQMENPPDQEFNKLASEMVDADVYSHIIFVHDSEINPDWNITDHIIYRSYKEFMASIGTFINEMMTHIETENRQELEESEENSSMIYLNPLGHTQDKRVLFAFNPQQQNETFYDDGGWNNFSHKIYEYLDSSFWLEPVEENKPFVVYADAKSIVIVEDNYVNEVIDNLTKVYLAKEKYEICSNISRIKDEWYLRKSIPDNINLGNTSKQKPDTPPKKKRGRPKKNKDDEDKNKE